MGSARVLAFVLCREPTVTSDVVPENFYFVSFCIENELILERNISPTDELAKSFATFLMMWEEKIDLLKKKFLPQVFRVPFTDGSDILKKIEGKFVFKQDGMFSLTNWAQNLKNIHLVESVDKGILPDVLKMLNENQTYWFVAVMGSEPTSKLYVYCCRPKAAQHLVSMTANDFFIVDKKLAWLTYFHPVENSIEIFKSGDTKVPFDKSNPN